MKRLRIRISGKVQGVFYRASAQAKAKELGLNGWVQNEEGGSVLIEAEGEDQKLQRMVEWCQVGPGAAQVEQVETQEVQPQGVSGFEVRR
ncbi:acylphosphatase [Cesiribacter andamanensis]|uniref:acylphosphatase n=1 Tax=Cesiribacter andamanensis AMV16 TaxID=1279009 RepID=M7NV53_9BACT|nr:acylphosphatase [Cesiribacter andamanensis]EMR02334.1 Acylphosphatase [Cesiribacter andamanensis AMV16]